MVVNLVAEKKKIEDQKKRIQLKEKLIKIKERQRDFKRIEEISRLAFRANINQFDDATLLGAFLEIAEKMQIKEVALEWKKIGECYRREQIEKPTTPLAVLFHSEPKQQTKEKLKELKFRWNPFRKEYCGHCNRKEIELFLKDEDSTIEIIA